jgi:hypothetical protein
VSSPLKTFTEICVMSLNRFSMKSTVLLIQASSRERKNHHETLLL